MIKTPFEKELEDEVKDVEESIELLTNAMNYNGITREKVLDTGTELVKSKIELLKLRLEIYKTFG